MRRKSFWLAVPVLTAAGAALAQPAPPPSLPGGLDLPTPGAAAPAPAAAAAAAGQPAETVDQLIARVRQRVEGIDNAAKERDEALKFLQDQIDAATGAISGGGEANEALRQRAATLSDQVDELSQDRQKLTGAVDERSAALQQLQQQVTSLNALLGTSRTEQSTLEQRVASLGHDLEVAKAREKDLTQQILGMTIAGAGRDEDLAKARQQVASLQQALDTAKAEAGESGRQAEAKLQGLQQQLAAAESGAAAAREQTETRIAGLEQQLKAAASGVAETSRQADARVAALQQQLQEAEAGAAEAGRAAEAKIAGLQQELGAAKGAATASAAEIASLGRDVQLLRTQLETVSAALAATGDRAQKQNAVIGDLTQRLNAALAAKIEELSRYRSDFFGRLRQALGDRPDFRVVGDRFVFQSEVLFDSGSADLDPDGQHQLHQLALALKEVAATIPPDIAWILRVDGHTDIKPISNSSFRSNWELSTARAISVVEFLVRDGIPPERLVAAGFGEFQPLDNRNDEIAYRRNRRIEFKLTER